MLWTIFSDYVMPVFLTLVCVGFLYMMFRLIKES